jgi:hypothetical protein
MLIKKYSCLVFVFSVLFSFSYRIEGQTTYNPLSIYGVGELDLNEYGYNAGMGGVNIGVRNADFLNNSNPASLTALDTNTFIYNMAVSSRFSSFKSGSAKENTLSSNIKKVAIGFVPIKGWGISAGLQPFSSIGYKITSNQAVEGTSGDQIQVNYSGNGGLNKLYISNAVRIFPGLSVGVNAFCVLGSISTTEQTAGWNIEKSSSANKVSWDCGLQYTFNTKKNQSFTFGAIYGLSYKLNLNNDLKVTDEDNNTLDQGTTKTQKQTLPNFFGFGASVKLDQRFTFASDYVFQKWSSVKSNFSNVYFTDVNKVRVGMEYMKTNTLYAPLMQRLKYQAGVIVGNSYLMSGQKKNINYALTLGLGIPIKSSLLAHISYEYGNAGLSGNLGKIRENYSMFNLSFSIKDFWFLKRKYD